MLSILTLRSRVVTRTFFSVFGLLLAASAAAQSPQPTISNFASRTYGYLAAGQAFAATSNSPGVMTYASGNTAVADIDATTGALTLKAAGTSTITLNQAAGTGYAALSPPATVTLTVVAALPDGERNALVSVFTTNNGASWSRKALWTTSMDSNPCTWQGVTCASNHVTVLDVSSNNLTGQLPSLAGLSTSPGIQIRMQGNTLSGPIPTLPSNVTFLALNNNQLTGSVDLGSYSALTFVSVYSNLLDGTIVSVPPSAATFQVNANSLTGTLPQPPATLTAGQIKLCGNQLWSGNATWDAGWAAVNNPSGGWLACQTRKPTTLVLDTGNYFSLEEVGKIKSITSSSQPVGGGAIGFTSSAPSVLAIDPATGVMTPVTYGVATITATQATYQNYAAGTITQQVKVHATCRQGSSVNASYLDRCSFPAGANPKDSGVPPTSYNAGTSSEAIASPGNASVFIAETDFAGPGPFPLRLDRYFNSQLREWRTTYERQIVRVYGNQVSPVYVVRADGKTFTFTQQTGGTWTSDADVNMTLTQTGSGWTLVDTWPGITEQYGADGYLQSETNRAGLTHTVSWSGLLQTVQDAYGRSIALTYVRDSQSRRRLQSFSDLDLQLTTYSYDDANPYNPLVSVTFPDAKTRGYSYVSNALGGFDGALIDGNAAVTYRYRIDGNNRVVATVTGDASLDTASARFALTYTTSNNSVSVVDPAGTSFGFSYLRVLGVNHDGSIVQPNGVGTGSAVINRIFDGAGNLTSDVDERGTTTKHTYQTNLETSKTEGFGTSFARTITTTLHATLPLPAQVAEPGRTTTFTYDGAGNLLTKAVTAGTETRATTFTYNGAGQMLTATDPLGHGTAYVYDFATGLLASATNALQQQTTYTYYPNGRLKSLTDPNGLVTTLAYDARGRVTSRSTGTETTSFQYDNAGQIAQLTRSNGAVYTFTYDAAHRLVGVIDAAGNQLAYEYDALGRRIAESRSDAQANVAYQRSRTFHKLGWVATEIDGLNSVTAFAYDNGGNQLTLTDPLSHTTTNTYDALSRLATSKDATNATTTLGYDARDNLVSVTDAKGAVTSHTLNGFDQPVAMTSPNTGTANLVYDASGRVLTNTDALGNVATFGYDALNRVTSVGFTDQTLSYGYDTCANGIGRLCTVSDGQGTVSFTYTLAGRVASRAQAVNGGATLTTAYTWDVTTGSLLSMTTPAGNVIGYLYDPITKLPNGITVNGATLLSGADYEPFGPNGGWLWSNGPAADLRLFDQNYRPTTIQQQLVANQNPPADNIAISWDSAGRIGSITETGYVAASRTFGYDTANRLTSASLPGGAYSWAYDAVGNRTQLGASGATTTYTYASGSQRLLSASGAQAATFTTDATGNITAISGYGSAAFGYNKAGRMTSATVNGVTYTFAVNALGQRYLKAAASGATMLYAYDGAGHLAGQYEGTGQLVQETVWFADVPVATIRPTGIYYVHVDHIGAPRTVTRPSDNTVMWRWDGEPFGSTPPDENPAGAGPFRYDLRFPGQVADPETGLLQNGFRDYSPALGRYIESDPTGLAGGINTYAYVAGNPLATSDPMGLEPRTYPRTNPFPPPYTNLFSTPYTNPFPSIPWYGHSTSSAPPRDPGAPPQTNGGVCRANPGGDRNVSDSAMSGYADSGSEPGSSLLYGPPSGNGLYDRNVFVLDGNGNVISMVQGSTNPDPLQANCAKGCPSIAPGTYPFSSEYRSRYKGPILVLGNNGTVPTTGPNPNQNGKPFATGVYNHSGRAARTGSEGCLTIDPSQWQGYMSHMPSGARGTITVVQ